MFEMNIPDHTTRGALDDLRAEILNISIVVNRFSSFHAGVVRDHMLLDELGSTTKESVGTTSATFGLFRIKALEIGDHEWAMKFTFTDDGTCQYMRLFGEKRHEMLRTSWAGGLREMLFSLRIILDEMRSDFSDKIDGINAIL